ncbi:Formamidase [Orchesella cincta]|uniref:Formamidase n=1 Tax=Orchesella cincta TaxID=48709 RepID=A0A1D2N460_ORCCI|nr:Formamidase [Orchesella cincta]
MVRTIIKADLSKKPQEMPGHNFHNRYHPDIPAVVEVKQDEVFKVECYDWSGGQCKNDDCVDDTYEWDLSIGHVLSGPIAVEGAEPGDILEVELLDIQAHPDMPWGFTAILPEHRGGGGFLGDLFKKPAKAIWDFEGIYAKSRHIPGVRFVGVIHPGIVATAPSRELLDEWNRRESELVNSAPDGKGSSMACLPLPHLAILGKVDKDPAKAEKMQKEAARTIPPRENGGNADIKNLSRGSRIWLPVYVKGANLSLGDIHFCEGDGEIALCGAIETAGIITVKTKVLKNGMSMYGLKRAPMFFPGPIDPYYSRYLTFEGLCVDEDGKQHFVDTTLAFRQAVLSAIEYLTKFGYTREQAYLFLSACPVESHIASIVDIPNACVTLGIPTEVFDFNILPNGDGPKVMVKGSHPPAVPK